MIEHVPVSELKVGDVLCDGDERRYLTIVEATTTTVRYHETLHTLGYREGIITLDSDRVRNAMVNLWVEEPCEIPL